MLVSGIRERDEVMVGMSRSLSAPLIGPEFDDFLFAPLGEERNGMRLSVISALSRLEVDPWQEAASLAELPGNAPRRFQYRAAPNVARHRGDPSLGRHIRHLDSHRAERAMDRGKLSSRNAIRQTPAPVSATISRQTTPSLGQ
jgi:hypothetical protein